MEQYKANPILESYMNNRGKELMLLEIIGRLEDTQKGG